MTAEQIIAYLELELADAYEQYDEMKAQDARAAFFHIVKATTIQHLLDNIKQ